MLYPISILPMVYHPRKTVSSCLHLFVEFPYAIVQIHFYLLIQLKARKIFFLVKLAPRSTKSDTISSLGSIRMAEWSRFLPQASLAFGSAPCSIKSNIIKVLSLRTPKDNGVWPSAVCCITLAPFLTRTSAARLWPRNTAIWKPFSPVCISPLLSRCIR